MAQMNRNPDDDELISDSPEQHEMGIVDDGFSDADDVDEDVDDLDLEEEDE